MRLKTLTDVFDMAGIRGSIGGPGDPLVVGTDETRAAARDELRRKQRVTMARKSTWEEIPRDDLVFGRHTVEHVPTGKTYRVHRGEVLDVSFTPVSAYYLTADDVVFLEPR